MKKYLLSFAALILWALFPMVSINVCTAGTSTAQADAILASMMSDDFMTSTRAIQQIRSGDLRDYKIKFEKAKANLIELMKNRKKNYIIRIAASDAAAFFEMKTAIPVLKSNIATDANMAIKLAFQDALDRLEGRKNGDKYEEAPAYSGTPAYFGTPGLMGTPQ